MSKSFSRVVAAASVAACVAPVTSAFPNFQDAFADRYPTSTLINRIESATGLACYVCHNPNGFALQGTAYRLALRQRLQMGMTIEQALAAVENLDSDGDGVRNITEILLPRADLPTEVGFHPGLVGNGGFDPLINPNQALTSVLESPLPVCAGDTNDDGTVNFTDLNEVLSRFGQMGQGIPADLNRDGRVDFNDLNAVLSAFGLPC